MSDDNKRIETHGDLSPGYVAGDFKVTQTIVTQRAEALRKQWRSLDEIDYPAVIDNEDRRARYGYQLALHLHRAFKKRGYQSFSGLVRLGSFEIEPGSDPISVYSLVTHKAPFSGALRNSWKFLHNPQGDNKAQAGYQDELNQQLTELVSTWSLDVSLALVDKPVATQFIYDPDARRISVGLPPVFSTSPAKYPDKVRNTTELLAFLSCVIGSPVMNLGDLSCITSHYPLFKLVLELLDTKRFQLDRIRVNVSDCEEWDYVNAAADIEVGSYSSEESSSA